MVAVPFFHNRIVVHIPISQMVDELLLVVLVEAIKRAKQAVLFEIANCDIK
jgi:hypothetical protein